MAGVLSGVFFPKFGVANDGSEGLEPELDVLRSAALHVQRLLAL